MERARGAALGLFAVIVAAIVLTGGVPGVAAVTITAPYSARAVALADLDGDPVTGDWSDAASATVPLENGEDAPYGSANLYVKHDGTYAYFRVDGQIDAPWESTSGNHFWVGFMLSPPLTLGHHKAGQDDIFFGESGYADVADYLQPIDTYGSGKPPAMDAVQDAEGRLGYSGTAAPYGFTAEWRRPLDSGDSQDLALVADGTTAYNFYVTTDSDGGGSSGGYIDHSVITNDNVLILARPPAPEVHDVTVTSASATPTSVIQGGAVTIDATVQNQGSVAETFDVSARAGTILVGTRTVSALGAGASQTLSFRWDTTGVSPSSYLIRVEAAAVAGETDLADNAYADGTVLVEAVVHDVAITAASATPLSGAPGVIVTVTASLVNQGNQVESASVSAYAGSVLVGTQSVASLGVRENRGLSFSWNTAGVADGSYRIRVEASALPEETDLADNALSDGTVVLLTPVHDVAVTSASASPLSATVGETVTISAVVENQGNQVESFRVTAYAGTASVGATTVTALNPRASASLSISWITTSAAPGSYAIEVRAEAVPGETDLADNAYADGTVTLEAVVVHDVAVTRASASPLSGPVGTIVSIDGTVQNQGTEPESFDVLAYAGDVLVGRQSVSGLAAGGLRDLTFRWDTSGATEGSYPIVVRASTVAGETDTADNAYADGTVRLAEVVHDVAVTSASASPLSATLGTSITISARVQNQGTQAETFDVSAYAGALTVAVRTASDLAAGASTDLSFSWDTSAVAAGSYVIRVEASAVSGEADLADNAYADGTVVLREIVHDVAVTLVTVSPTSGLIGDAFAVSVQVQNQGTEPETVTVTARANDLVIGTRTASLSPGREQALSFAWSTADLTPGEYTISASMAAVPGETDLADNTYTDGTVALQAPPPLAPTLKLGRIWPEWRRATAGTAQVLYAKVVNVGPVGAWAQVVYDVYDRATGALVSTVRSAVVWVPAGATVDGRLFASEPWTGPVGIYNVVGTLVYGTDPAPLPMVDGVKAISRFVVL